MATSNSTVANSLIGVAGLVSNLGEICTHRACYLVDRSGAACARLVVPDSPLRRKRDAPTDRIIPPTVVGLLLLSKSRPGRTLNSQGNTAIKIAATTNVPCAGCSCVPSRPGWASFMRALGLLSGVLVLVTDGYGPLIELGIWCLSADSHFSTQSLAQSLLVSPPFVRHACCLGTRGSDEHSFHDCFSFKKPTPDKRMHGQCSAASRSQWHPAPRHSPRGGQRREDGDRIASVRADEFEHGQAAIAANDRLAVDDAAPDRQGLDRLSDEREAVRKVVTVAGKEPRVATEFESEHPGYCGAQETFYVGKLKGVGRVYQKTFIDTYAVARPLPSQAPGAPLAEATAPPQ